jgi:low temperature requirement protein LtrA
VLIAIGESVVAIGIGSSHLPVDFPLVVVAAVGLALSAGLWWLCFGGDDERAERALTALPPRQRSWSALNAFGYCHLPMLGAIVAVAAAERRATSDPFAVLCWAVAAILAGGVALYLIGDVLFRRELGIANDVRLVAAVLAAVAVPLGAESSAVAELGALVLLLAAVLAVEARRG